MEKGKTYVYKKRIKRTKGEQTKLTKTTSKKYLVDAEIIFFKLRKVVCFSLTCVVCCAACCER